VTDWTLEGFEARARARLSPAFDPATLDPAFLPHYGDYRLNPTDVETRLLERARPAAVLIAACERQGEARLILTERTPHLRAHSGQVAFPGGKIDPEDEGPAGAALREAQEEIGLDPARLDVLGHLDGYITTSGYRIAPVVAIARAPFSYALNPQEVAHVFEAPLAFLMDPARHEKRSRPYNGAERYFYAMPWNDHYIWGVTAGIIRLLYERLYAE
jgi:8-oxo-dGTP pyrophosphatase MutT (NUDIX family)